jgi:imidazolonepropionase-like amidohydrolase
VAEEPRPAGQRADLVLLDANPLAEIGATRGSRAVVAAGRLLDRVALDGLPGPALTPV